MSTELSSTLYIPKRIKVGFQKRDDTFSGKLAYIIYWDDKGKLRKETSWQNWRDKKIPSEEFDNVPTTGLVLNKDIKRYNSWSDFGGKRTMIRVWDARGIEIEITTHNLIGVLMHSDCIKRQLMGEYVWAWDGTELVLLPTSSEEYQKALSFTALQAGTIGAKDLVPGCAYRTKKQVDLTYVGRFNWHSLETYYDGQRKTKKYHIFHRPGVKGEYGDKHHWELKSSLDFLATKTTEQPVEEYAAIVEAFQKNPRSAKVVKWEAVPVEVSLKTTKASYSYYTDSLKRATYHRMEGNIITEVVVKAEWDTQVSGSDNKHTLRGYSTKDNLRFDTETEIVTNLYEQRRKAARSSWTSWNTTPTQKPAYHTAESIQNLGLCDLYVTLDNGKRIRLTQLSEL